MRGMEIELGASCLVAGKFIKYYEGYLLSLSQIFLFGLGTKVACHNL